MTAPDITRLPVPAKPPAQVRRKIPAPFQRPSITISGGADTPKRAWRHILACEVRPGDTLPGVGIVESVSDFVDADAGYAWTVTIIGGDGNVKLYEGNDLVFVFCAQAAG